MSITGLMTTVEIVTKKVKDEEIHGCLERNHHAPLPQRESIESHLQQPDCAQKGFQIGDH